MSYADKIEVLQSDIEGLQQQAAEIYKANAPKFDRGIAEAAMERSTALLLDLKKVFDEHKVAVSFSAKMQSEQQVGQDGLPIVIFGGILVNMETRVFPLGKEGNESISDDVRKKLVALESDMRSKEAKVSTLVKKMHGMKQ